MKKEKLDYQNHPNRAQQSMVRIFFAPGRLKIVHLKRAKLQKEAANAPSARIFPIRPKQSKKPPFLPFSDHGFHLPVCHFAPSSHTPSLIRIQHINLITNILIANNSPYSTSQNHKSQITINKKSIVEKVKKEEVSLYIYLYLILYILYIIYIILILPALTQASQKQQLIFC